MISKPILTIAMANEINPPDVEVISGCGFHHLNCIDVELIVHNLIIGDDFYENNISTIKSA